MESVGIYDEWMVVRCLMDESTYRHCDHCKAFVPVTRKLPKASLVLILLSLLSAIITLMFFTRFIFIFIFLPFGFGLWRKAEYCAMCGGRIRPGGSPRANPE